MKTCIVIPCFNEEASIGTTISDFQAIIPRAQILVVDNNSTDGTKAVALAHLRPQDRYLFEPRQGKGNAVRSGLGRIDADVYIMVDGDNTYTAADAKRCLERLIETRCDLVNGDRLSSGAYGKINKRTGHSFGNVMLTRIVSFFSGKRYGDVLTGLRVMPRPFVRSLDVASSGFQLETEFALHSAYLNCLVYELPIDYQDRPHGSESKLNSYRDGSRILVFALISWFVYKPVSAYASLSLLALLSGLGLYLRPALDLLLDGNLELAYSGSFALGSAFLTTAAILLINALIIGTSARLQRRKDIANYLEERRKWNANLDENV